MTLSSLLNDGPALTIAYDILSPSSNSFAWSDMPVIGDFPFLHMELNHDMMGKADFLYNPPCEEDGCHMLELEYDLQQPPSRSNNPTNSQHNNTTTPKRGHKKSVSFNRYLEVREHALTIGDHPLCRDSLPLSLAWEHGETEVMDLNCFEEQRLPHRRSGSDMRLTYFERKNLLRRIAGMTEADMREHFRMHESLPSSRNLSCFAGLSSSI
jgi:hypothetical protein